MPGNLLENAFVSSVVAKPVKLGDFCARGQDGGVKRTA